MADLSLNTSIIKLNTTVLNIPVKRLPKWIKKHDPTIYCLQKHYFKYNDILVHRMKVKGWKRYTKNINQRKAGVAKLMSDKVDFRAKKITGTRKYYIL